MQHLEVSGAVRHTHIYIYIYIYVIRRLRVKSLCSSEGLYRVIHKSVKNFKNSQQIDYATDHGNSYADRERNSPSFFFLHISQMLNMSTFGNTTDIYAIVHLVPHKFQHITVDQSHSSGDTVAKRQTGFIPEFRIPLLDTVENRCCLLEFCSKSSLHSHNGRGSCVFQNTK